MRPQSTRDQTTSSSIQIQSFVCCFLFVKCPIPLQYTYNYIIYLDGKLQVGGELIFFHLISFSWTNIDIGLSGVFHFSLYRHMYAHLSSGLPTISQRQIKLAVYQRGIVCLTEGGSHRSREQTSVVAIGLWAQDVVLGKAATDLSFQKRKSLCTVKFLCSTHNRIVTKAAQRYCSDFTKQCIV